MTLDSPRPPEAPLSMPAQSFAKKPDKRHGLIPSRRWRKAAVGVAGVATSVWGTAEMYRVLDVAGVTTLEWILLALFAVNICWIAFSFASATFGLAAALAGMRSRRKADETNASIEGRTAIAFPIYNEEVRRVFATVAATAETLKDAPGAFDCFILSDTTDPEIALEEEAAFLKLRERGADNVYYRRRTINRARKAGNIHDFVSRWGGRYDYMIVFDADSYMEADTILKLARRMEAAPDIGLIQTVPKLVGGETLFGRAQQFASSLYGPMLGSGIAWWAQSEGNFWGHNAIIRTLALAEAAGLPEMPGRAPFGGNILSHDFVEAALLRRAGWRVRIDPDLNGSYEEGPPTMIDMITRDRRWCQGNLQHMAVLARGRGLKWTNRLHLGMGIWAYLSSPAWLLFILIGLALSLQNSFLIPKYFGESAMLFPSWPIIDPARALNLFIITMGILFAPKLYGMIYAAASAKWRNSVGVGRSAAGVISETLISALAAPILMAEQTWAVISVLSGQDSGWSPQKRGAGNYTFIDVLRRHALATILGIVLFALALAISPIFAAWLSPAVAGLILAAPLSYFTGSEALGRATRKAGLLMTPQEHAVPPAFAASRREQESLDGLTPPAFQTLLTDETARERRRALPDAHWPLLETDVHIPLAIARARADRVNTPPAFEAALSKPEQLALLNAPVILDRVADKLADSPPAS